MGRCTLPVFVFRLLNCGVELGGLLENSNQVLAVDVREALFHFVFEFANASELDVVQVIFVEGDFDPVSTACIPHNLEGQRFAVSGEVLRASHEGKLVSAKLVEDGVGYV